MKTRTNRSKSPRPAPRLPKCPTGIQGLDEITGGGLPRGRPTLVCGGAGCGKTLLAAEFLVRGAAQFDEPGVLMAFEETEKELKANVASLGFDLEGLVRRKKIVLDYVHIERGEFQESGEYDLEGIFVRLGHAIDSIGAKRVVLDTLEVLFASLPNEAVLRSELRRLFRWLKDKGVTAVITAERGREQLTRHGLEEYVSDCVIVLDHRVNDQIATRHLRVVKYRGALHGTNEFPFLIGEEGLSVLPITSLGLNHQVSTGQTDRSLTAFANLKRICESHLKDRYCITVIDLLKQPQLAKGDQILAIPTVVRKLPKPVRTVLGALSDTERVLVGLDLRAC